MPSLMPADGENCIIVADYKLVCWTKYDRYTVIIYYARPAKEADERRNFLVPQHLLLHVEKPPTFPPPTTSSVFGETAGIPPCHLTYLCSLFHHRFSRLVFTVIPQHHPPRIIVPGRCLLFFNAKSHPWLAVGECDTPDWIRRRRRLRWGGRAQWATQGGEDGQRQRQRV